MNKEIVLPELTVYVNQDNQVMLAKNNRTGCFERLSYAQEYYDLYTKSPNCISWNVNDINNDTESGKFALLYLLLGLYMLILLPDHQLLIISCIVFTLVCCLLIKIDWYTLVRKSIQSTVYKGV